MVCLPIATACVKFLSTPSARRATRCDVVDLQVLEISIHALREEGDVSVSSGSSRVSNFYPRPPRGGRRAHAAVRIDRLL